MPKKSLEYKDGDRVVQRSATASLNSSYKKNSNKIVPGTGKTRRELNQPKKGTIVGEKFYEIIKRREQGMKQPKFNVKWDGWPHVQAVLQGSIKHLEENQ